ncbi:MAG: hypothetical protein OEV44_07010, partial [Spirochaetota bacterium]|nr:hypothetical protein [Spirochaetota bacterium]
MQLEKEYFNKDKWLVSARRIIQIFAFILFFFLIFHTQKVKELDISIPIYLFVTLILTLVIYLYRFLILYFKNNIISKSLLTKTITVILFTIFLFFLLSHYKQFSKPNRITYLNNKSITIKAAISQYENDKKRYNSFKNFTSLKTSISNKTDGSIEIILPPLLLYINYLFLLSAIVLIIKSIFFVVSKRKFNYIKHYIVVSIILFIFSILIFALL